MEFFSNDVLLKGDASKEIYKEIKDLPIIDYHCHLDQHAIKVDGKFEDIGELWLAGDHYKWRAMRMAGIPEEYITGNASFHEKFLKYASIMPLLVGNPLYYWTHFELKQVFGIEKELNFETAEEIYSEANKVLKTLSVQKLLKLFNVEFVATTNDPTEDLKDHGIIGKANVTPTFRPDKLYNFDSKYLEELGKVVGYELSDLDLLEKALQERLDFFKSKGCKITDHGFRNFPKKYASCDEAKSLYLRRDSLTEEERDSLFGYLLVFLMKEYKKRNLIVQMHFSVTRNINTPMYKKVGVDAGFDVISEGVNLQDLINFLDKLPDEERPTIILYSLNPEMLREVATITGAFRNVRVGAAWWFNDTLLGIRRNLEIISEYSLFGTNLGMLTDSRSFSSYSRFDFFRRILSTFLGEKVDAGEYSLKNAIMLAKNISYYNIKNLFGE